MHFLKKSLPLTMALVVSLSGLSACSSGSENQPVSNTEASSGQAAPAQTAAATDSAQNSGDAGDTGDTGEGPFDPPVELTWLLRGNETDQWEDGRGTRGFVEIQDRVGVIVNVEIIEGNSDDQLKLMLASGNFPDIIRWTLDATYPGGIPKMVSDDIAMPLNDLIDDYMPNFSAVMAKRPDIKKEITNANWEHLYFPFINPQESDIDKAIASSTGFAMRSDWLENVGMDAPDNMDDWYNVLTAFKNNDPNGDRLQNEVPFEGTGLDMFTPAFGIRRTYFLKPGTQTVAFGPIEPEYREYLETMNKWYTEGLVTDNSITSDGSLTDANIVADLVGSWKALTNNWEKYLDDLRQINPNADFIPVDWPTTKDGKRYTDRTELINHVDKEKTIITTSCKNPMAAAKLIDYMYSEEGGHLLAWGFEGVTYEEVDGKNQLIAFEKDADPVRHYYIKPHVTLPRYGFTEAWAQTFNPQRIVAAEAWSKNVDSSLIYPPFLVFSQEDTNRINDINNDMGSYINDMTNAFIDGSEPLSNFDTYVENVKRYGVEEIVEIYQRTLDDFNAK